MTFPAYFSIISGVKKLLYAAIVAPIFLTGGVFAWVWQGETELVGSMSVPPPPLGAPVESSDPLVKKGQEIFNAKGCVYCHGPNGAGGVKNPNSQGGEIPSLSKVAEGFSKDELKAKILAGVKEIGKEDPKGRTPPLYMPTWKGHVSEEELDALAAFLMNLAPKSAGGADDF